MKTILNSQWLSFKTVADAYEAQKEMAEHVILQDAFTKPIQYVGGMDVSNTPFDPEQMIFGAAVVCSYPSLARVETETYVLKQTFPYVPGLLGFREVPVLVDAFQKLSRMPDVIMVDGHGISHPRSLGVASHVGVVLDVPTIGVAKSILVGKPAAFLSEEPGSMVPLMYQDREIAMLVRTKKRCNPLIVSAGYKISLATAAQIVLACVTSYRLPEPTRFAHNAANTYRMNFTKKDT